jgi:hypothetical protein
MQQAKLAQQSTVDTHGATPPGAARVNAFVINLCSSTSPVALIPPDHAGLKRFSFFVSRRREESRERFRLHMGYFDTQEEAEKLLDIVREIYPGAWAGLAPGQRLRAGTAPAGADAAGTSATAVAPMGLEPSLEPAPASAAAAAGQAEPMVASAAVNTTAARPAEAAPADGAALALLPDEGRRLPEGHAAKPEHGAAARSLHDVRAAIASLDDSAERAPPLRPIPELKPAGSASPQSAVAISERRVLAVLEDGGRPAPAAQPAASAAPERNDKRPSASQQAQPRSEKPYYAVQLMWSVQPMDITQVPQLAIFSAYTLYGAEGNRDGRRWYGLRLGFFTDAVSARQVAHYVRSEFSTVSVVPVTPRERERARRAAGQQPVTVHPPASTAATATAPKAEFNFIEDKAGAAVAAATPGSGHPRGAPRGAPGKRAKLRTQSAAPGGARTRGMTLEETLEILGAGELQMDDGRTPLILSSAPQGRAKSVKAKASRLGRLFERLAERLGS